MPITEGKFEYERKVNTGEYQHRAGKATVTFTVGTGESEEDLLARASALAVRKVHEAVGLEAARAPTPAPVVKPATEAASAAAEKPAAEKPAAGGRGRPPGAKNRPKEDEPAAPVLNGLDQDPFGANEPAAEAPADDGFGALGIEEPAAEPAKITDAELQKSITSFLAKAIPQTATNEVKAAIRGKVKTLLLSYAQTATLIPQEKRAEFLTRLEEIKA